MIACKWQDFYEAAESAPGEEYFLLVGTKRNMKRFDGQIPVVPQVTALQLDAPLTIEDPAMFGCVGTYPISADDSVVLLQKLFLVTPDLSETGVDDD